LVSASSLDDFIDPQYFWALKFITNINWIVQVFYLEFLDLFCFFWKIMKFQLLLTAIAHFTYGLVTYDQRSLIINNKRELIFVGHVHYPRSPHTEWDNIFQASKDAGINAIDTYVFWNEHEAVRGSYDFQGNKNLRLFIEKAHNHGLYVILRIGPYVIFFDLDLCRV
jgi:hypothetical protein